MNIVDKIKDLLNKEENSISELKETQYKKTKHSKCCEMDADEIYCNRCWCINSCR